MIVFLGGQRVNLLPNQSVGKGGEADVFLVPGGQAVKVFKRPDHPDLRGQPLEQKVARDRISEHQTKLLAFPKGLPDRVIVPQQLATDRNGSVVGYSMKFLPSAEQLMRYGEKPFRQAGVANDTVTQIFLDLHNTVEGLHKEKVTIGDFNDLNVLVVGNEAYIIDADSFQFGSFLCRMFTERYIDPLICDPKATSLVMYKPYVSQSDWYAFAVMLMQSLLFVGPYGGVYKPKIAKKRVLPETRPLQRITIFDPEVVYPKPAIHYSVLPDELLQYFHEVFEKDQREVFPVDLIATIRWTQCSQCSTEHARVICPKCAHVAPAAIKSVQKVVGKVIATRIFKTSGVILQAAVQDGKLLWLYHENGQFKREGERVVKEGSLDPQVRYRICQGTTLFGKHHQLDSYYPTTEKKPLRVDSFGNLAVFDANDRYRYWVSGGNLTRDSSLGDGYLEHIGRVLEDQTLFWVGPKFGFGFYRAGDINVAFVFNAEKRGLKDNVEIPPMRGQLLDANCVFTDKNCWLFMTVKENSGITNRCVLIHQDGTVVSVTEARSGDGSWLSQLQGKCGIGDLLFSATNDGIIRLEVQNGQITPTKEFSDTEPFVSSESRIFPAKEGLYVIENREITLLKMN